MSLDPQTFTSTAFTSSPQPYSSTDSASLLAPTPITSYLAPPVPLIHPAPITTATTTTTPTLLSSNLPFVPSTTYPLRPPITTVPGRTYTAQELGIVPPAHLGGSTGVVGGMVPRVDYERAANECKNWQVKYNQLYLKYLSLLRDNKGGGIGSGPDGYQLNRLREENFELEQRLIVYQNSERMLNQNIEHYIVQLVNKYRDAAVRESNLLMDRFRLECKQETRTHNT